MGIFANIMVKRGSFNDGFFLVVDYDSGGKIKQVRYLPHFKYHLHPAAGGSDLVEQLLKVEHDLQMLDHIWDGGEHHQSLVWQHNISRE